MIEKIKRNIIIAIIFSAVIYVGLSFYSDSDNIFNILSQINLFNLPLIFLLSFLTFFFRFIIWHNYTVHFNYKLKLSYSFILFFSSLIMSVTPGKVGELIKAYMLKKDFNLPVSKTTSIIFAERITEMISLIFLALFGAFLFDIYIEVILSLGTFFVILIYILTHKNLCLKILDFLSGIRIIQKYKQGFQNTYLSVVELLEVKMFLKMFALSVLSWIFECFAFYLIMLNFFPDTTIILATFIFTFSIIVGSFSMVPGGIGVAEGSLTFLLKTFGFDYGAAIAATLLLRISTLWFSVFLGIVFLSIYQAKYGKIEVDSSLNQS